MDFQELFDKLATCTERGKATKDAPFPPELKGQDGAAELTDALLAQGVGATEILNRGLMVGMNRIGDAYSAGTAFVPELLLAARAMKASMTKLKPLFAQEGAPYRGRVVLGTVQGDLHDIGKSIVRMVLEGDGWEVVDLGVDVPAAKFVEALGGQSGAIVGMSAMLTTTMANMESMVREIKDAAPGVRIFVGGAPLTSDYSQKIGADGYFPDPRAFARHLATLAA